MSIRYQASPVAEGTTPEIRATLVDASNVAIPGDALATLRLTIYDLSDPTHPIINAVENQDILNTDRGTVDSQGLLIITLEAGDTAMVDATRPLEQHLLLIEWTYGLTGEKVGRAEVALPIQNLTHVPYVPPGP